MQYTWYEIVGMSVLVGAIVFIVFRGLDLALEALLRRMSDRQARKLSEVSRTADAASESMLRMADAAREMYVKRPWYRSNRG